jgi:hypothetical protein
MLNARRNAWYVVIILACSAGCLAACSSEPERTLSESGGERLQGELKRVVVTEPELGASRIDYFLALSDETWLPLELEQEPNFEPNLPVVVHGEWLESVFHVEAMELVTPSDDEAPGTLVQPLLAPTPKRVAVVLFNFSNDTSQPIDAARAKELVFSGPTSSNAYYQEVSFSSRSLVGVVDPTGDVFGWYTLDQTSSGCSYQAWGTAARAKAQAVGVDLSVYDHVVHYFPRVSTCSFSGVGQLPGPYTWIKQGGSQTIAHELGHNFGVHHASSYRCRLDGVFVPVGGSCTSAEYGDVFDVMGTGYRHFSGYHKETLGFLEAANVQTVTESGSFELAPLEQPALGLQVLRYQVPGTSDFYYVEYRQPFGFDKFSASSAVSNGVLIRLITIPSSGVRQTKLIDTVPSTASVGDAPLLVGKTFADAAASVAITLSARTATSATVEVIVDGLPPNPCADGEVAFGDHCYFLTSAVQTFNNARTTCVSRGEGWNIVSIESAEENVFVSSQIGTVEHWVSGRDFTTEGTFIWASGVTFWTGGLAGSAPEGAYANFFAGEPNNTGDCLRIVSGGQWRDAGCTARYPAVCEK